MPVVLCGVELPSDLAHLQVSLARAGLVAHAPDDDRRMVTVTEHHVAHLTPRRSAPPAGRADALPRGDLSVDHDSELVAGVEKGRVLGVVGEADEVAAVVLEEAGVGTVELLGQGAAEPGNRLVPVTTVEIDTLTVEEEAFVRSEFGAGDAEADPQDIRGAVVGFQCPLGPVELRIIRRPAAWVQDQGRDARLTIADGHRSCGRHLLAVCGGDLPGQPGVVRRLIQPVDPQTQLEDFGAVRSRDAHHLDAIVVDVESRHPLEPHPSREAAIEQKIRVTLSGQNPALPKIVEPHRQHMPALGK